jgi:diguanylate cyclase (GGDEF)-like protein/PAS domain S-box-containing protein
VNSLPDFPDLHELGAVPVDASRALLARLLTDLPEGALITDASRRIKHANAGFTAMTGYAEAEIRDSNCSFLQGPETDPATIDAIRAALEAERTFRGPILNYKKDGTEFWNFLTIAPLRDLTDVVTHFVSVQLDVTDFISGHDITRQLLAAERAQRETASLLLDAARALNRSSSVAETTATISDLARSLSDGDHSTVATWDDRRRSLVLTAHSGAVATTGFRAPVEQPDADSLVDLESILGAVAPVTLHRDSSPTLRALQPELSTSTALAMPITADDSVLGLVVVGWDEATSAPDSSASGRLGDLAELAGYAFAKAQIFDEIRWNAVHDPLTRLLNRSVIADTLATFVERGRTEDTSTAVLYCDVDRFKHINDTLGHDAGDTVLVAVAAALQGAVRLGDIVARMGGDEFVVILNQVTGVGDAEHVVNRIRAQLERPIIVGDDSVVAELSIGIAIDEAATSTETVAHAASELLRAADAKMYEDKTERSKRRGAALAAVHADTNIGGASVTAPRGVLAIDRTRSDWIFDAFSTLADTLVAGYEVLDLLQVLVEYCHDLLETDSAGILLSNADQELEVAASTSQDDTLIHAMQLDAVAGPGIESFRTGRVVSVADLDIDAERWPAFADTARSLGIHSVYAIPLRLRGTTIGTLNLMRRQRGELDPRDVVAAHALADVATIGMVLPDAAKVQTVDERAEPDPSDLPN